MCKIEEVRLDLEETGFQEFLASLQEGDLPFISPMRFADKLRLEKQRLAQLAHVHRNTLTRMPQSAQLQKFLRDSVRVLAAASQVSGSANAATFWFRNQPIAEFNYQTPDTLVSDGRTDDLLRYLEILEAGPAG
jgi:uncharacterized protein (DUF2384 family)